jgi:inosine-uridine nucleoside N-ribohydrolase
MLLGLASCTDNDDNPVEPQEYDGVPLVILDTDIGSSTDDLFSMEMLYHYQQQNKCKFLGVVVDREGEDCAACADVMNTYFNNGSLPIGLVRNGIENPTVWINYKTLPTYKKGDGTPMFAHSISDYSTLLDGWQLYRKLLAAQPDHSVSIVSLGFVTSLAQLLESGADKYSSLSGVELVRQKVKCLYIQGGSFGESPEPDYNFLQGMEFAKTFIRLWPSDVDIVFSPMETGNGIEYQPEQVIADVSWTDEHPIKQVYMTCNCNTGQRMWDPLTVINAVEGDHLFTLTGRGTVVLKDDGTLVFTPSATGNSRFQMPGNAEWNTAMLEKICNVNKSH